MLEKIAAISIYFRHGALVVLNKSILKGNFIHDETDKRRTFIFVVCIWKTKLELTNNTICFLELIYNIYNTSLGVWIWKDVFCVTWELGSGAISKCRLATLVDPQSDSSMFVTTGYSIYATILEGAMCILWSNVFLVIPERQRIWRPWQCCLVGLEKNSPGYYFCCRRRSLTLHTIWNS